MNFFADATTVKNRVPHRCIWCGQMIATREGCTFQSGMFDGEFQRNYWHPECWDAADDRDMQDGFTKYEGERPAIVVAIPEMTTTTTANNKENE